MRRPDDEKLRKRVAEGVKLALPKVRETLRVMRVRDVKIHRGHLEVILDLTLENGGLWTWNVGTTVVKGLKPLIARMDGATDYKITRYVIDDLVALRDPDVVREHKRLKEELARFERRLVDAKLESRKDEMRSELRSLITRGKRTFGLSRDQMVSLFQEELKLLEVEEVFQS